MPGGVGGARASLASTRFEAAAGGDPSQSGQHAPRGRANLPPTLHRRSTTNDRRLAMPRFPNGRRPALSSYAPFLEEQQRVGVVVTPLGDGERRLLLRQREQQSAGRLPDDEPGRSVQAQTLLQFREKRRRVHRCPRCRLGRKRGVSREPRCAAPKPSGVSSRPTASSSVAAVAGHAGGAEAAERRPRGRPSAAGFHQSGHVFVADPVAAFCPKAAVRAMQSGASPPARLLLLCVLFRSSWLAVEGGRGRRRHSAASPGRTGGRGRVGRRGCWRSKTGNDPSPREVA